MTAQFRTSLVIDANGKPAQAELARTAAEADKAKTSVAGLGTAGQKADADLTALQQQVSALNAQLAAMTQAEARAVQQMTALSAKVQELETRLGRGGGGRGGGGAAGSMGNLVANFNDLGVMMAAGQNPLQLAIQQGTQITQVIGPMGAAGAATALRAAFVSMLSPINLVTIGGIAAGAAMIQWLTSAGEEARTLEDLISGLENAVGEYRQGLTTGMSDLRKQFGSVAPEIVDVERALQEVRLRDILLDAAEAANMLSERFDGFGRTAGARLADVWDWQFGGQDGGRQMAAGFDEALGLLEAIGEAEGPHAQAEAARAFRVALEEAGFAAQSATEEQQELYDEVLATERALWRAAGAAGEMAGPIAVAADEAARLADEVLRAMSIQNREAARVQGGRGTINQWNYQESGPGAAWTMEDVTRLEREQEAAARRSARGSGGGRRSEVDALDRLIERQQTELDLLRETDPVQQELIRNRRALEGATDAERASVEKLIAQRIEEEANLEAITASWDFFGSSAVDSLDALIFGGEELADVMANLSRAIAQAALQAILLGDGPLAGMFGIGEGGGIIGMIGTSLGIPAKAEGGIIRGPGSGTSDEVLMWGSNGEFVVNAKATAQHRSLLEAINGGANLVPGFAAGGIIGGWSRQQPSGGFGASPTQIAFYDQTGRGVAVTSEETVAPGGGRSIAFTLSDAVAGGMAKKGGGARRALKAMGVQPPKARR